VVLLGLLTAAALPVSRHVAEARDPVPPEQRERMEREHREQERMEDPPPPFAEMFHFLEFADVYSKTCGDSRKVAVMAAGSITELFEKRGERAKAADLLEKLLKDCKEQSVRNAIRFALKENYEQTGRVNKAIDQAVLLVTENDKVLAN